MLGCCISQSTVVMVTLFFYENPEQKILGSFTAKSMWLSSYIVMLFLGVMFSIQTAHASELCQVCKLRKEGQFYVVKSRYYKRDIIMCRFCHQLDERCEICSLPVLPKTGLRLPDKRVFCPDHAKTVVVEPGQASSVFSKAKDEAMDLLRQYPPLPHLNITFHMVTREDFVREYRRTPGIDNPYTVAGLTIPRRDENGQWIFDVYVVHGLSDDTFLATCAHEYAHTWLTERETQVRQVHKDTVEGFCELIAYKVASKLGMDREMTRILENPYSRGQVNALVAAEKEYSFYKIVRWMTDGVDSWVDVEKMPRLLALRDGTKEEEPPVILNWAPVQRTQAPQNLILKGLSGTGNHRFALINDATLAANEEGKVRVGTSNLIVRCLLINSNSVTIQVRGEATPRQLLLGL